MPYLNVISGLGLLAIALILQRATRERLQPAFLFCLTWATVLFAASIGQYYGYDPIDASGLPYFISGALLFSTGSLLTEIYFRRNTNFHGNDLPLSSSNHPGNMNFRLLAITAIAVHALAIPIWWQQITTSTGSRNLFVIAYQARFLAVSGFQVVSTLIANYLTIGLLFVPLLLYGLLRRQLPLWMFFAGVLPWIFTNLITNGRSALVQLIFAIFYIYYKKTQKVRLKEVALLLGIFFLISAAGAVLTKKAGLSHSSSFDTVVYGSLRNIADYALQGPILFAKYSNGSISPAHTWNALQGVCQALSHLNLCTPIPSSVPNFYKFGSDLRVGNVYSIYYSLVPNYGILGLLLLVPYGAWSTYHHLRFTSKSSLLHGVVAAYLSSAALLSIFSDNYAPAIYFLLKIAIGYIFLVQLPRTLLSRRRRVSASLDNSRP